MAWILVGSWVFIQLLVVVLYAAIDGRWLDRFTVVELGRVHLNENGKTERLRSGAGAGGFQEVLQESRYEPEQGHNGTTSHLQCEAAEDGGQGAGQVHGQFGPGISRQVRSGEGEGSRDGRSCQAGPLVDHGGLRELLERRARECGLFGHRVDD